MWCRSRSGAPTAALASVVAAAALCAVMGAYPLPMQVPTKEEVRLLGAERALLHFLLDDYDKSVRPVKNYNDTIIVTIGVKLNQIMELQERLQILSTIVAVDQEWRDEYLQWDPADFGGLNSTYLPCSRVWLPDVVLYNGVSNIRELQYMQAHVSVKHTGHVVWFPLVKLDSSCTLDIRFYPYDEQLCLLKFGSWSYSKKEVDVTKGETTVEKQDYVDSGEFELKSISAERVENVYDCCPVPIPTLNIGLRFRRRPMFSIFTLAVPCTLLSLMTATAFILPPENGGKIEVQLSVMLSLAVFMLLIGESLPPTPDSVPLLGVHIVIQMGVTATSFVCSIFVMRIIKMDYREMPPNLKKASKVAARWLLVGHANSAPGGRSGSRRASRDWSASRAARNGGFSLRAQPLQPVNGHRPSGGCSIDDNDSDDTQKLYPANNNGLGGGSSHFCSAPGSERALLVQPPDGSSRQVAMAAAASCEPLLGYARIVAEHLQEQEERDRRKDDWRTLGLVLDRFLLICLALVDVCTTLYMYVVAPTLIVPKA